MKKIFCVLFCVLALTGCSNSMSVSEGTNGNEGNAIEQENTVKQPMEKIIEKTQGGNPITGFGESLTYGGDPNVLVDGDTVYLYTGHDASTDEEVGKAIYNIPEYLCYSSKDMIDWTYE